MRKPSSNRSLNLIWSDSLDTYFSSNPSSYYILNLCTIDRTNERPNPHWNPNKRTCGHLDRHWSPSTNTIIWTTILDLNLIEYWLTDWIKCIGRSRCLFTRRSGCVDLMWTRHENHENSQSHFRNLPSDSYRSSCLSVLFSSLLLLPSLLWFNLSTYNLCTNSQLTHHTHIFSIPYTQKL